ncbi:cytochrome c oxidase subunit 3 [Defluviicoccus vanus]|uniref:cytochrome-c oxidase n=1 Tax=Defluviicoccus vanus TaxID=111831 RepID=A0A7H1N423_9PROT|nr:cytochrome c oxidase subunit 3 [Defluviicoccus vanus]QNT70459.1 cytochrome c oxidase subunit 3 [Defluviicoccus vanus]
MATHTAKTHPFHMVDPSPWPAVGTAAAVCMAIGGIWFMHDGPPWVLIAGFCILLATFFGWWRDVVKESRHGDHSPVVAHGLRVGVLLFIASEVMFFFAFFWAYFNSHVELINAAAHQTWPPEGITPLYTWGLPFLNTLILLTSGATITIAHHAVRLGDREKTTFWTGLTVLLGVLFLGLQATEYHHASFGFTDGIFSSTFFMATGFHGFHVFVGACALLVCFLRSRAGHFTPEKHVGFEAAAWYWHFVDVVWLFLFVCIYWWGGASFWASHVPGAH